MGPQRANIRLGLPFPGVSSLRPGVITLVLGVVATAASLVAGCVRLKSHAPPQAATGIAFATPIPPHAHRGLYISEAVSVPTACQNPVHVSVVVGGTKEYWLDAARRTPARARIGIAISDPSITRLNLAVASRYEIDETAAPRPPSYTAPESLLAPAATLIPDQSPKLLTSSVKALFAFVQSWGRYQEPIVATFDANWISPRDASSCYLRLPALAGPGTALPLALALTETIPGGGAIVVPRPSPQGPLAEPGRQSQDIGSVTVAISEGALDLSASAPPPVDPLRGRYVCGGSAPRPDVPVRRTTNATRGSPAPSTLVLEQKASTGSGCRAVIVIDQAGGSDEQNVYLLGIGAALGLGLALFAQGLLRLVDP